MTDEPYGLPDGWKSWPLPAKRFIRTLLVRLRDEQDSQPVSGLAAVLDDLDEAERAVQAGNRDAAVAAIGRVRDKLLGITEL